MGSSKDKIPEREGWQRQFGESWKAYKAFLAYLDQGPNRSYRKLAEQLGRAESLISRWGHQWRWQERVTDYDEFTRREAALRLAEECVSANKRHVGMAKMLQAKALERLNTLEATEVNIATVVAMIRESVRIEREALGMPITSRVEVSGPGGGPVKTEVQRDMDRIAEEYADAIRSAVFGGNAAALAGAEEPVDTAQADAETGGIPDAD